MAFARPRLPLIRTYKAIQKAPLWRAEDSIVYLPSIVVFGSSKMRFLIPSLSVLLATAYAIPATNAVAKSDKFELYVTDNSDIGKWAVVNSVVKDRTSLLMLKKPAGISSTPSLLLGSQQNGNAQLRFLIKGRSYGNELQLLRVTLRVPY